MIVMRLGKTIRELSHGMIVHIDERRDALGGAARLGMRLLHAGTSKVTNSLRSVVITTSLHIALKFRDDSSSSVTVTRCIGLFLPNCHLFGK
jgi:hypothetical protein